MRDARAALMELGQPTMLVEVAGAQGSTPRETDAWMLVSIADAAGTIGGGQLEYMAIDHARQLLRRGTAAARLVIPLGPEIGQCCGGRVTLALTALDGGLVATLRRRLAAEHAARPQVLIFGAGHVGRALAAALSLVPVRAVLIDQREAELALAGGVETRLVALPEAEVAAAPPASAFVVLTHDPALDFMIVDAALVRGDAAYVGMIGSASKRARFLSWRRQMAARGGAGLTCPIGGPSGDKRPEVIAALTAAEILTHLGARPGATAPIGRPNSEVHDDDHDRRAED